MSLNIFLSEVICSISSPGKLWVYKFHISVYYNLVVHTHTLFFLLSLSLSLIYVACTLLSLSLSHTHIHTHTHARARARARTHAPTAHTHTHTYTPHLCKQHTIPISDFAAAERDPERESGLNILVWSVAECLRGDGSPVVFSEVNRWKNWLSQTGTR